MDTGRVKSSSQAAGLRADLPHGQASARQSEAGDFAAKILPAFLLELTSAAAEPGSLPESVPIAIPRDGVVVNLSRNVLGAEKDLQLTRDALPDADRNPLDPKTATVAGRVERALADYAAVSHEILTIVPSALKDQPAADRAASALQLAASNASGELRPDLYAYGHPLPAVPSNASAAEQETALSEFSQARDLERLAGLILRPGTPVPPGEARLSKLLLAAIVVGVLIVILI